MTSSGVGTRRKRGSFSLHKRRRTSKTGRLAVGDSFRLDWRVNIAGRLRGRIRTVGEGPRYRTRVLHDGPAKRESYKGERNMGMLIYKGKKERKSLEAVIKSLEAKSPDGTRCGLLTLCHECFRGAVRAPRGSGRSALWSCNHGEINVHGDCF